MNKSNIGIEDLQSRISNFIEKAKDSTEQIKFEFSVNISEDKSIVFSSVEGMNIYRIIQEAINNALKYAKPKQIAVSFEEHQDQIDITIVDDGVGFDLADLELGNGINNMSKRAIEINGAFDIQSNENKGTTISLMLPIPKNTTNAV